ncbi:MFS transporter [Ideonella sp. BN130291]|uniref:MFS transporter n=1 Tax=Ideonella sp. BN130291 TaxID=3112940 RepID=UPI002E276F66|nr:MFS transporter [Ideonella sp. BN130291]
MPSTAAARVPDSTLVRASRGVRAQFFVAGALFATWGVHVPTVKAHYRLGEQALAIAMLASGVGALLALTQAGRVVGRHGPRAVALACGLVCTVVIAALLAFESYAGLLVLMLAYGVATSLFDVSINAEATEVERLTGRALMSGFHGMFSLGGMVGAAAGAAVLSAGVPPAQHLLGAALLAAGAVLLGGSAMLRMQGSPSAQAPMGLPRGALLWIGLLAAAGLLAEGAMYDWSVLYLKQDLRSDAGTASLAYASFSAAMAIARFAGDWVRARMSPVALLRWSGALGAAGMALALLVAQPAVALFGFALVGLGFANVVPVLFSAAAKVPGVTPAHGIAAVSSLAYLGMMAGPPLIGVIAEHQSLTAGLFTVVLFAAVLALSARRALPA